MGIVSAAIPALAQSGDGSGRGYTVNLAVDEVVLTFHATDVHGLPVNDIQSREIKVLDDGAAPQKVIAFDPLLNRPLRAAILLDTSESMDRDLPRTRLIAEHFAEKIFRQASDEALVTQFGYSSVVVRSWTGDASDLARSIQAVHAGQANPLPGTALMDAVFRTCYHGFGTMDSTTTGNVILLFSDGEDTSSHTSIDQALRACQRSNTVIYAFHVAASSGPAGSDVGSLGSKTLADLAAKTGGRVFPADDNEDALWNDLRVIDSEMRNQYRLVYRPTAFKHDGAFHSIELQLPDRVSRVEVRPGYFAPEH